MLTSTKLKMISRTIRSLSDELYTLATTKDFRREAFASGPNSMSRHEMSNHLDDVTDVLDNIKNGVVYLLKEIDTYQNTLGEING